MRQVVVWDNTRIAIPAGQEGLYAEANAMIERYAQQQAGISYPAQGYHCGDGVTVPAHIIAQHMIVHGAYNDAWAERREQEARR